MNAPHKQLLILLLLTFLYVSAADLPFVLGLYSAVASPGDPHPLSDIKAAGFTHVQAYAQQNNSLLDAAQAAGLKVIFDCCGSMYMKNDPIFPWDKVKGIVDHAKGHPALDIWYLADEPEDAHMSRVDELNAYIKSVDPQTPTSLVIHWRKDWYKTRGHTDIWMCDYYPVRGQDFPNAPLEAFLEFMRSGIQSKAPGQRFIAVPQACDFRCFKSLAPKELQDRLRYPNLTETRAMAWSCVSFGAHGLFWFAYWHCHRNTDSGRVFWNDALVPTVRELNDFLKIVPDPWNATVRDSKLNDAAHANMAYWSRPSGKLLALTLNSKTMKDKTPLKLSDRRNLSIDLTAYGDIPANATLRPFGMTATDLQPILKDGHLTVPNLRPWETCIWQIVE